VAGSESVGILLMIKTTKLNYVNGLGRAIVSLCVTSAALGAEVAVPKDVFVMLEYGTMEIQGADGNIRKTETISESGSLQAVPVYEGEIVRTTEASSCLMICPEIGTMKLDGKVGLKRPVLKSQAKEKAAHSLEMLHGKIYFDIDGKSLSKQKKEFRIRLPIGISAVRGTRFFVETDKDAVTAGVHEGLVMMQEDQSGNQVMITDGKAAMAKPGSITRPRPMTEEERALSDIYESFAVEFVDMEDRKRIYNPWCAEYMVNGKVEPKDMITAEEGAEFGDSYAIKLTFRPSLQSPRKSARISVNIKSKEKYKKKPKFALFSVRGQRTEKFAKNISVMYDDRHYLSDWSTHPLPAKTTNDEWVTYCIPLEDNGESKQNDDITAFMWFDFHSEDAKQGQSQQGQGNSPVAEEEYFLEISPIKLGVSSSK
jgi:hypothetical protein